MFGLFRRFTTKVPKKLAEPPRKFVVGEGTIMGDGQLGGEALERGPERTNPEGSSGTPNPPPDRQ